MITAGPGARVLVRLWGREDWHGGKVLFNADQGETIAVEMDGVFTLPTAVAGMAGVFAARVLALEFHNGEYREVSNGQTIEVKADDAGEMAQAE